MTSDGFTVNWITAGSPWIVHYMALGGPDLTNAAVGTFTPTSGTGSQSVAGLAFQPDFLMFLSVDSNTVGSKSTDNMGKVSTGFAGRSAAYNITQAGNTATSPTISPSIITSSAQSVTAVAFARSLARPWRWITLAH